MYYNPKKALAALIDGIYDDKDLMAYGPLSADKKKDISKLEIEVRMLPDATTIAFTQIDNDTNGNPRYVCHFLNLLCAYDRVSFGKIDMKYAKALKNARALGGKKYHNKKYGGGIAFQSYNIDRLGEEILEIYNS